MKAYGKIYESIVGTKPGDEGWKAKVDATIKKHRDAGLTQTQAMKHAVMELNTESTEVPSMECIYLKVYSAGDRKMMNVVLNDGTVAQVEVPVDMDFPQKPAKVSLTNVRKDRLLLTDKTTYRLGGNGTLRFQPVKTTDIIDKARTLDSLNDGDWGLIRANATAVMTWDEDNIVTPDRVNVKLNFTSAGVRSGLFLRTLSELRMLLPSDEDSARLDELVTAGKFPSMLAFVNDVISEQRDYGLPGAELLIYGQCNFNTFKGRNGNDITGKNLRTGIGGFAINIERLLAAEEQSVVEMGATVATEVVSDESDDDGIPIPTAEHKTAPVALKDDVLAAIRAKGAEGLDATELAGMFSDPQNVSTALNELWGEKKITLSKNKFVAA